MALGAPEVPGGDGAVGLPGGADFNGLVFGGEVFEVVEDLDAAAEAEVVDGEEVGAAHDEDEEHFGGPAADAFDGEEGLDDVFVGHGGEGGDGDFAAVEAGGEVEEVGAFLAGEAAGADDFFVFFVDAQDAGGGGAAGGEEGFEFAEHRGGGGGGDLLGEDGVAEGGEGVGAGGEGAWADAGDEGTHGRVDFAQVAKGAGPVGGCCGEVEPHGGYIVAKGRGASNGCK